MQNTINRRQFLDLTALGAAGVAASLSARAAENATPERVVVGVMGLSRGRALALQFAQQPGVEVRYVCDVDSTRAAKGAEEVEKVGSVTPKPIGNFHEILDDKEVDALVCATPNHWHAPATILACSAGKHVYVEKPCCHNPREGELMIEAARKNKRAVQVGTQRRSSPTIRDAIEMMLAGEIGRVYSSRATYASLARVNWYRQTRSRAGIPGLRIVAGSCAAQTVYGQSDSLQLALVLALGQRRTWKQWRPLSRYLPVGTRCGFPYPRHVIGRSLLL